MATLLAVVIALALPLIYFSLQYQSHRASMEMEARFSAATVSDLINKNPEFWRFEEHRLEGLLKGLTDAGSQVRRIVDAKGRVIVQSHEKLDTPVILNSAELRDSGTVVGRFEVLRSLRPLLVETAAMGLIGLFLGSCVLMLLRVYPLRSLNRALESLASEKRRAELVLNSIGDGVIAMNSLGIMLSCNPAAGKIFGYEPGELVGQNVKVLLPASYHAEHDFYLQRFLGTGQEHRLGTDREITAQRRDGGLFHYFTVLVFFSAGCDCQTAHDARLGALAERYRGRGVALFAVDSERDASLEHDVSEARLRGYPFAILLSIISGNVM